MPANGALFTVPGAGLAIRRVDETDMAALLAVYRQCEDFLALGPRPRASEAMIRGDLAVWAASGGAFCGIFAGDGSLIGVLDFVPGGHEGQAEVAFLELLMLAREQRGRGQGTAIVRTLHAHLAGLGARAIAAGVQVNNPAGQRFWQQMGYRVSGGPEHMPDATTVYHLWRPLP